MMRNAQSTQCRAQLVAEYFAAEPEPPCGRCDNCRTDAPHALAS